MKKHQQARPLNTIQSAIVARSALYETSLAAVEKLVAEAVSEGHDCICIDILSVLPEDFGTITRPDGYHWRDNSTARSIKGYVIRMMKERHNILCEAYSPSYPTCFRVYVPFTP